MDALYILYALVVIVVVFLFWLLTKQEKGERKNEIILRFLFKK